MIIDASVALKWLIEDDDSGAALSLLAESDLRAPALIHAEVANAIWKKQRRGEFGDDPELGDLPERLASIISTIDECPVIPRALALAVELDHPVYDCVYLAVAEAYDEDLVTADAKFLGRIARHASASRVRALIQR